MRIVTAHVLGVKFWKKRPKAKQPKDIEERKQNNGGNWLPKRKNFLKRQ
jgi:hypothetical protein